MSSEFSFIVSNILKVFLFISILLGPSWNILGNAWLLLLPKLPNNEDLLFSLENKEDEILLSLNNKEELSFSCSFLLLFSSLIFLLTNKKGFLVSVLIFFSFSRFLELWNKLSLLNIESLFSKFLIKGLLSLDIDVFKLEKRLLFFSLSLFSFSFLSFENNLNGFSPIFNSLSFPSFWFSFFSIKVEIILVLISFFSLFLLVKNGFVELSLVDSDTILDSSPLIFISWVVFSVSKLILNGLVFKFRLGLLEVIISLIRGIFSDFSSFSLFVGNRRKPPFLIPSFPNKSWFPNKLPSLLLLVVLNSDLKLLLFSFLLINGFSFLLLSKLNFKSGLKSWFSLLNKLTNNPSPDLLSFIIFFSSILPLLDTWENIDDLSISFPSLSNKLFIFPSFCISLLFSISIKLLLSFFISLFWVLFSFSLFISFSSIFPNFTISSKTGMVSDFLSVIFLSLDKGRWFWTSSFCFSFLTPKEINIFEFVFSLFFESFKLFLLSLIIFEDDEAKFKLSSLGLPKVTTLSKVWRLFFISLFSFSFSSLKSLLSNIFIFCFISAILLIESILSFTSGVFPKFSNLFFNNSFSSSSSFLELSKSYFTLLPNSIFWVLYSSSFSEYFLGFFGSEFKNKLFSFLFSILFSFISVLDIFSIKVGKTISFLILLLFILLFSISFFSIFVVVVTVASPLLDIVVLVVVTILLV